MTRTLAVFAKQPVPGRVKTRLAAQSSPAWAAEVYEACLLDLLDRLQAFAVRRVVVFDPLEGQEYFRSMVKQRYELAAQSGGDLGARLQHFFAAEFERGARAVVAVGADSPSLPGELIAQAFAELARADVVLGPCTDGGYYLLGARRLIPALFDGIDWSSPRVLEQTIRRLEGVNATLAVLPPWYDVDTLDDWQCLRGHIAALLRAGIDPQSPRVLAKLAAPLPKN